MCLHPVELMQIFPLTSAGLGLTPSLRIALEMLLMETTYFAIQDPKQNQVPPRLLPARPRCLLALHEHSHPFPSHPGPEEERAGSPSPLSAWDDVVVLSSAGPSPVFLETSPSPPSFQETSPVTPCQSLVCHGESVASPVWASPDVPTNPEWNLCSAGNLAGTKSASAPPRTILALAWRLLAVFIHILNVHKKCSIRHEHLGRQTMETSLSERWTHIKTPRLLKWKHELITSYKCSKCHFLQMNTSNQFNFSNKMIKLLLLWNHYFIA